MIRPEPITQDAVLDGRLLLTQPRRGHRVGHEAMLLAAACPARAGDTVVELGAGVGAAGLAVAMRVESTIVTLVDIDSGLVALASDNAQRNRLAARVRAVELDVAAPARAFAAVGLPAGGVMRVLMNPPFNDPGRQRPSTDAARRLAHSAPRAMLAVWTRAAARLLRPSGTLTMIWRADGIADVLTALTRAFGGVAVIPVYPRPGKPAIRIVLNAVKGSRAPLSLLPGLTLADTAGHPTPAAEALLRNGAPLPSGNRDG